MIAPMSKYSFLVYHADYDKFIKELRELGIVHIIENNNQISENLADQYQYILKVSHAIRFLENREVEKTEVIDSNGGEKVFNEINNLNKRIDLINQKLNILNKEIAELKPWGDFSVERIQNLENKGISIKLYVCQNRNFKPDWESKYNIHHINKTGGLSYFALILLNEEEVEINAENFKLPTTDLNELQKEKENLIKELENIQNAFDEFAKVKTEALKNYRIDLIEKLELEKADYNTKNELNNSLKILEVWVPDEKENLIIDFMNNNQLVAIKSAPSEDDKVPVLLKNKNFYKDFEVIGEMYSLPKYGELDLTPFFAPFYALFFGFCLGDVGYGMLMLTAAFVLRPRVKKELKAVTKLIAYLGSATILFGLIGGTFFGIPLYETNLPIYSSLQQYFDAENTDINNILFYLSLLIGGIQIIFGLIIKAVNETRQLGWKLAIGTIGWIVLIVGLITVYLLGEYTNISESFLSGLNNTILIFSGLLILVLNNLKRKIHLNIGIGLWNSYNMITGILGDLLSYIRLFALGISSAILGFVFNSLAVSMSGDIPVLSIIIMIVILIIGHAINIFMSGLGAFVHPMRLTFVEFYKNAGFTGGGKKYHPFKRIKY